MNTSKVWFITGASKGMGLLLTKIVLDSGGCVAATSRSMEELLRNVGPESDTFLPLKLDITDSEAVKAAIVCTVEHFGRLDVAVNNAGFSYVGALEELQDAEFRKALDVNLFGTVNVIRAAMAPFRKQRSGHVINISSAAGYLAGPNIGSYVASKFAVVGLTEALALEAAHLGVKATVVLPGSFRTNFLDEGSLQYARQPIADYDSAKTLESYTVRSGRQPGDPRKLADALLQLAAMDEPPVHLILGPDSFKMIMDKKARDTKEFEAHQALTFSTDLT